MSTTIKPWNELTEAEKVALLKNLDTKLPGYVGTSFPEITTGIGGVTDTIHKGWAMADWLVTGSQRAESSAHTINSYKGHHFEGPVGTSMATVPAPAVYGVAPPVSVPDIMGYVGTLRGKLTKNTNMTDDILKDLWLFGTEVTFDPTEYVAIYSVNPFTGYIHIHVGTKNVKTHHVYLRKAGTTVWEAFISFNGANFDLVRVGLVSPENLEILIKGVIDNKEIGKESKITPFLYKTTI